MLVTGYRLRFARKSLFIEQGFLMFEGAAVAFVILQAELVCFWLGAGEWGAFLGEEGQWEGEEE